MRLDVQMDMPFTASEGDIKH